MIEEPDEKLEQQQLQPIKESEKSETGIGYNNRKRQEVANKDLSFGQVDNISTTTECCSITLSKNQLKKLNRKQKREEFRMEKRKEERERRKQKRKELHAAGLPVPKRIRIKDEKEIELSDLKIVIDLDFTNLMSENDLRMVLNQVKFCYAENRKIKNPCQLTISSFKDDIKDLFIKLQPGCINWKNIDLNEKSYLEIFDKEKVIYLTSDSDNILHDLDLNKVYIIGGLVDHNQHKGVCYKKALKQQINHQRLPIEEFVKVNSRKVLTINHVFEILLHTHQTKNWENSFFKVIPKRKGVESKNSASSKEVNEIHGVDTNREKYLPANGI